MSPFFLGCSAAAILAISISTRILLTWKHSPGFDVYGHLLFAKLLRIHQGGPYGKITLPMVAAAPHAQPFLWHWIVGRFSTDRVLLMQSCINGLLDSIFVCLAFLLAFVSGISLQACALASLLYLLTPLWFSSISYGPRLAGFTPRLSSEVTTNLLFLVCFLPLGMSSPWVMLIGAVLVGFVLSSSKFGLQALLFLVPLAALTTGDLLILFSAMLGLVATILVSRGKALDMFSTQLSHLVGYAKANFAGKMEVSNRNSFRALFSRNNASTGVYLRSLIYGMLRDNSYTAVALKAPIVLVAILIVTVEYSTASNGRDLIFAGPIIAASLVYFVVNLRPLLFLGEAERYLNHIGYLFALCVAVYAVETDKLWVVASILAYGLTYWFVEFLAFERLKPNHLRRRAIIDDLIVQELKGMPATVVLCYPFGAVGGAFRIGMETPHKSIYFLRGCYTAQAETEDFEQRFSDGYPYVKLDKLDDMAAAYGIGYLVIDKKALERRHQVNWRPSTEWEEHEIGGEIYSVYQRSGKGQLDCNS